MTSADPVLREQALGALKRLRGRIATLSLMEPEAGRGGAQFGASLDALLQPLSDYIAWADRLLDMPEGTANGALGGKGLDAWYVFSPPAAILADTERLIEAVDAFMADPLAPSVRAGLEAAIDAVIRPALDQVGARSAGLIRASSILAGSNPDRSASGDSTPLGNRDPSRPSPFDEEPERPSPRRPGRGARRAGVIRPDVSPVAPGVGGAGPGPIVEVVRLDDAERQWWQDRFNQFRRRVNAGLSLIAILGIGLLVVTLYETFALRDPAAARHANTAGPDNVQALSGRLADGQPDAATDAVSIQTRAEISGADPMQAMQTLQQRVLELETQILRLNAGMGVIDAELRVQSTRSSVSAESAIGAEGAGTPMPVSDAVVQPAVDPEIERRLAMLEMKTELLSIDSAPGRTQVASPLQSPLRSPLQSQLQEQGQLLEQSRSRSQVPPSGLPPVGPSRVDPAPGAVSLGSGLWPQPASDQSTLAGSVGSSVPTTPPSQPQTGRSGPPGAEPGASAPVAGKAAAAAANCQAVFGVLDRFGAAYDAGALDALLALYSKDASENATQGQAGIRRSYEDWFGKTSERRIRFAGARVQTGEQGGCRVSADYRVDYRDAGGRTVERAGTIEVLFDRPGADALIQRIAY